MLFPSWLRNWKNAPKTSKRSKRHGRRERRPAERRFRPLVELLEDRTLLSTFHWVGDPTTHSGAWNVAANWQENALPGNGDDVAIASSVHGKTFTISVTDSRSIDHINFAGDNAVTHGQASGAE